MGWGCNRHRVDAESESWKEMFQKLYDARTDNGRLHPVDWGRHGEICPFCWIDLRRMVDELPSSDKKNEIIEFMGPVPDPEPEPEDNGMKTVEEIMEGLREIPRFKDMDEVILREHAKIYHEDQEIMDKIEKIFTLPEDQCEEPTSGYVNQ